MDRSMENGDDSGCRDRECRVSSWEPMSMANADFRANVWMVVADNQTRWQN
jgi:hypothetical protein